MTNFLYLALLALVLASTPVFALTYQISHQKGSIKITRNGVEVSPPITTGDRVHVSKGGMLVLKAENEIIKVFGDTIIEPRKVKEGTLIDLVKGGVVSLVTKKKFWIRSKTTVFGVRGTQFFVQSSGDEAWMCVEEGLVNVKKKNVSVNVPAGKGVFVGEKEISKPESYAWTKGINWKMDPKDGELDQKINMKYDLLENFYD